MHEDPTDLEIREMWADRERLERMVALRDERYPEDMMPLNQSDFDLWRAKLRAEMNSLTGVLDGLMICRENSLILPNWLSLQAINYIGALSRPDGDELYSNIRTQFKAEKKKIVSQKRAQIVNSFLSYSHLRNPKFKVARLLDNFHFPAEVQRAIETGIIRSEPTADSAVDASELASKCLNGTWASATAETIRQDYINAKAGLKYDLGVDKLNSRQITFIGWDVAFVRPETLQILGLAIALSE